MSRPRLAMAAIAGTSGYYLGSYNSGKKGYAPFRSKNHITAKLAELAQIKQLQNNPNYEQFKANLHVTDLSAHKGGVSDETISFRNQKYPKETVSFVFCGPNAVGFPNMVHGGLICTLFRQAAHSALKTEENGTLDVRYIKPTKIDQVIRVESQKSLDPHCLDLVIYAQNDNSPLARAKYYTK